MILSATASPSLGAVFLRVALPGMVWVEPSAGVVGGGGTARGVLAAVSGDRTGVDCTTGPRMALAGLMGEADAPDLQPVRIVTRRT